MVWHMTQKKVCITFAGVVGSSKSPITNYLSTQLNLPVFNNDIIRTEVQEDIGSLVEAEYLRRRDERLSAILKGGGPFIYDASVDRAWLRFRENLLENGYEWFIVSMDLSKELLLKLYNIKGYEESKTRLDTLMDEHQKFLGVYNSDVGVHIDDAQFGHRLVLAHAAVSAWMVDVAKS